jgi:hypothetical protein
LPRWVYLPLNTSAFLFLFLDIPELNPADGVWSHIKYGRLPNYTPFDLLELRNTVTSELKRLQREPHLLRAFIRRTRLNFES